MYTYINLITFTSEGGALGLHGYLISKVYTVEGLNKEREQGAGELRI